MLKREKIASQTNSDLSFLDDKWDQALLGYAERGGPGRHIVPCYGYQAAKAILKSSGYSTREIFKRLEIFINSMQGDRPLLLTKYKKKELWKIIRDHRYPTWELMDSAILGIGSLGWVKSGVVYSKPLCASILHDAQSPEFNRDGIISAANAVTQLEKNNIAISLGEYTPWFLTPVQ